MRPCLDFRWHGAFSGSFFYSISLSGHTISTPPGSFDPMFIAEFDTSGSYLSGIALRSGGDDECTIITDNAEFLCKRRLYAGKPVFGNDSILYDTAISGAGGGELMFTGRFNYDTVLCAADIALSAPNAPDNYKASIMLSPDPAANELRLAVTSNLCQVQMHK